MTSDRDELFRLFDGMHVGSNGADEHRMLQGLLRTDPTARSLWYLSCDVEAGLAAAVPAARHRLTSPLRWLRLPSAWAAAAAMVAALLWIGIAERGAPAAAFATLIAADNARWSDPNTELMLRGSEMPPGRLILESGKVDFRFSGGARVTIEGPANFETLGPRQMSLHRGKVFCQCLTEQAHMTVITPVSTVIDLGTEFTVQVDDTQITHVAVVSGTVSVGSQGSTRQVSKGRAVVIGADHTMREEAPRPADFAALMRSAPRQTVAVGERASHLRASSFTVDFPGPWISTSGHCTRVDGRGIDGGAAVCIRSLGSRYWPLISQRVAVHDAAGQIAIGSIAALDPSDDPLTSSQHAIVKLVCRDAKDMELGQAECHFQRADQPRDRYERDQVSLVVPPGTATIEFQALLNANGLQSGCIYFDAPTLYLVSNGPGADSAPAASH